MAKNRRQHGGGPEQDAAGRRVDDRYYDGGLDHTDEDQAAALDARQGDDDQTARDNGLSQAEQDELERRALERQQEAGPKPAESKAQRFHRLAPRRIDAAVKRLGQVANLANRGSYEYTADEAGQLISALAAEMDALIDAFSTVPKGRSGFKFDAPEEKGA